MAVVLNRYALLTYAAFLLIATTSLSSIMMKKAAKTNGVNTRSLQWLATSFIMMLKKRHIQFSQQTLVKTAILVSFLVKKKSYSSVRVKAATSMFIRQKLMMSIMHSKSQTSQLILSDS